MAEYIEREKIVELSKILKDNFAPLHRMVIDAFIYNIDKNIPTADVQEVKHGKWRLETDEEMPDPMMKLVVCSFCHKKANGTYNFCPNCGADMRKVIE